jgi:hypothetical protein
MSRWFRFYDEALDDPKVQRLAPHNFRVWVNLLCISSKNGGTLPTAADIAFKLRMSELDAKTSVEDLIMAGLIDIDANGVMTPHNWKERQFASDTSKDRTRKWRKNKENKVGDVTVTARDEKCDGIETYTDTETDSDLVPSSIEKPRGKKEQSFNLGLTRTKGTGRDGLERVKRRAEGLGLPVDDLVGIVNKNKASNRTAYFTSLCVTRLQQKLPGLDEGAIRAALWDSDGIAFGNVCNALLAAEAV